MDTKLTLRLDEDVIARAKKYAVDHQISLSKMIESYLESLTQPEKGKGKSNITPLVESLSGVITLPPDFDYKKVYRDHLEQKYQ